MTMAEYEALAQRTSNQERPMLENLLNGVLGLAGESGECCDLVKKRYFQDGREIFDELVDELGDVLWYIVETAVACGHSLEEVAEHNIEKLKKRYPDGFSAEKSLHRE